MQTGNVEKWFLEDYVGSNCFLHWIRSSLSGRVMSHLLLYLQLLAQHLAHTKNSTNIEGTDGLQREHQVAKEGVPPFLSY